MFFRRQTTPFVNRKEISGKLKIMAFIVFGFIVFVNCVMQSHLAPILPHNLGILDGIKMLFDNLKNRVVFLTGGFFQFDFHSHLSRRFEFDLDKENLKEVKIYRGSGRD